MITQVKKTKQTIVRGAETIPHENKMRQENSPLELWALWTTKREDNDFMNKKRAIAHAIVLCCYQLNMVLKGLSKIHDNPWINSDETAWQK